MNIFLAAIVVAVSMAVAGQEPRQESVLSGRVLHSELPVPGATVTASRNQQTVTTTSDENGVFRLANLAAGAWVISVEMRGFATVTRDVTIPPNQQELSVTLAMRPFAEMVGAAAVKSAWPPPPALGVAVAPKSVGSGETPAEVVQILQGSVVNGAATIFAQPRAIGNNRPRAARLYSGSFSTALGHSAWNARPYSFGGAAVPIPDYGNAQFTFTIGGPFWIPGLFTRGPLVRVTYARGVQHNVSTRSALVPTIAERAGDLSSRPGVLRDPQTGQPFDGNVIPGERIAPQASALLAYYPFPNGETSTGANFQRPLLSETLSDRLSVDANRNLSPRTIVSGSVGVTRSLSDSVNIFDFTDRSRQFSITASGTMSHRVSTRLNLRATYQFTHADNTTTPHFANRLNVSGEAGISGNDQDPVNWGPPAIAFPDFVDLRDGNYQHSKRMSHVFGGEVQLRRGRHNLTFGADARLQRIELLTQPDPRGTLTFTGAATGNAFGDFLLGLPSASAIAFGNASARVSGGVYDAYISDDFRIAPGLTADAGVRWEYESPYTERDGRLANLDVLPDFTAAARVVGSDGVGALTGTRYPASLVRRDLSGVQPRIGVSWRPDLTSSLTIRGGYGLYRNLGVYQSIGALLAQQPPFSTSFSIGAGTSTPLSLANPFPVSVPSATTFAVDPGFTTARLHSFSITIQRDLPASLTMIAGYFGDRGADLAQAFLPNTFPAGAANPCEGCPAGFIYLTSGGRSTRNAGVFTLRRRLSSGFTASVTYTLAKAWDNAATFSNSSVSPGSLSVAQNWLDLDAEWGPSSFDQRHLVAVDVQYTSGMGIRGGTLVDSWWGKLFKDWTIAAQFNAGSGMPVSPSYFVAVPGTGVVGVRPSLTGEPIAPVAAGSYANPAAFAAPSPGTWGDAGRNSIRGPSTSSLDMNVTRVFRFPRRFTLEWRLNATNAFNRVTYSSIDRIISSPQFGRPTGVNQMRRVTTSFRFGF
jgi:trimeric autotransporter adhesin